MNTIFCSFFLPHHPGHSGGEIRDFHLIKHLLKFNRVFFFSLKNVHLEKNRDSLKFLLEKIYDPKLILKKHPRFISYCSIPKNLFTLLSVLLRSQGIPILDPHFHFDVSKAFFISELFIKKMLQNKLKQEDPDFLFVSPQSNPVALCLNKNSSSTRFILASYDVESVRMRRIAESVEGITKFFLNLEAEKAERFERKNLTRYDGIIAVSELDKEILMNLYGLAKERIVVVENSVDSEYFTFNKRSYKKNPNILFMGSFGYLPNQQAAWRLIKKIMPLVWKQYPDATVSIVGQKPGPKLMAQNDNKRIVVTGEVPDVRHYLRKASLTCIPLLSGSGTKYKVLEAMSAGVPIICTSLANEGLNFKDGENLLVRESDEELADAIILLIKNRRLASQLASNSRAVVEKKYSWDTSLSKLDDWLLQLKKLPMVLNQKQ